MELIALYIVAAKFGGLLGYLAACALCPVAAAGELDADRRRPRAYQLADGRRLHEERYPVRTFNVTNAAGMLEAVEAAMAAVKDRQGRRLQTIACHATETTAGNFEVEVAFDPLRLAASQMDAVSPWID